MTSEQLLHFLKGGIFTAIFNPKELDISNYNLAKRGQVIKVHQSYQLYKEIEIEEYLGQRMFLSSIIEGTIPEEDLDELTIINEYISFPEKFPRYIYKINVSDRFTATCLFGDKGKIISLPYRVVREFSEEKDEYVIKNLAGNFPVMIEKAVYDGSTDDIDWIIIRNK